MNGDWQTITEASGQPFVNEGLCIDYAIHHPVSLEDLAGSLTGPFSEQIFVGACAPGPFQVTLSSTYAGSNAVGPVVFQMVGCSGAAFGVGHLFFVNGPFTLTTKVGTLSGTAFGPFVGVLLSFSGPGTATLTLTATSGTGLFTGTTGTLNANLQFPDPQISGPFVGTITPA
jgi:hypothetical protein